MNKVISYVENKNIWVSVDEMMDANSRCVANIIIVTLKIDNLGKMFLLNFEVLEKINHSTNTKMFNKTLSVIWLQEIKYDSVLLFLSDATLYIVKAVKAIQALYSKKILYYLFNTCLAFNSWKGWKNFALVDEPIELLKNVCWMLHRESNYLTQWLQIFHYILNLF